MKKFVLDRSKWYRGATGRNSRLHRSGDGLSCCLGLYLKTCGMSDDDLHDVAYPYDLRNKAIVPPGSAWTTDNSMLDDNRIRALNITIAMTNDDPSITSEERESRLTKLFAIAGVGLEFV